MMGNKKVKEVDCFFVETGREDHLKLFSWELLNQYIDLWL
jgi:hypothetical protein